MTAFANGSTSIFIEFPLFNSSSFIISGNSDALIPTTSNFELKSITKTTSEIAQNNFNDYILDFSNGEVTKNVTLSGSGKLKEVAKV